MREYTGYTTWHGEGHEQMAGSGDNNNKFGEPRNHFLPQVSSDSWGGTAISVPTPSSHSPGEELQLRGDVGRCAQGVPGRATTSQQSCII